MADTYLVAEIGTGHGGDLSKAKELIRAARECGADCAKFQYVIADEIVHERTGPVTLPGGAVDLHARFRALERDASPAYGERVQKNGGTAMLRSRSRVKSEALSMVTWGAAKFSSVNRSPSSGKAVSGLAGSTVMLSSRNATT